MNCEWTDDLGKEELTEIMTAKADSRKKIVSALPPKADICGALAQVCFGPIADISICAQGYWTTVQCRKKIHNSSIRKKFELAMERGMLSRAEEYRQRAKDCEQAAQETIDAGMKALFQELGNQWLHLASEVELPGQKEKVQ